MSELKKKYLQEEFVKVFERLIKITCDIARYMRIVLISSFFINCDL